MTIRFPLWRRAGLRLGAAAALTALAAVPPVSASSKTEAGAVYPALTQPSFVTPKAAGATMLGLARAGQRLVAVGERGIVLLSDDRGGTWRQVRVPVSVSLTAVRFADARTGWATGHFGTVLRTEDGGESWTKSLDGIEAARLAEQAAQRMVQQGLPGAQEFLASSRQLVGEGPDKPFLDLFFANGRDGFVVGAYNLIFRTRDGGRSWEPWMSRLDNPKGLHLYGIARSGSDLYIVGEQGLLLRSTDGGERFTALRSPYKGSLFGLTATADGALLAYGLRGSLYRSTDRGESWDGIDTGTESGIGAGTVLGDGTVVLASQSGDLLVSRDGGAGFRAVPAKALPLTALADAGGGRLAVGSLRGVLSIDMSNKETAPNKENAR